MTVAEVEAPRAVYEPGSGAVLLALGGKARGLLAITEAGLVTPAWFAVLPGAVGPDGSVSGATRAEIAEACGRLAAAGAESFAVRSSGLDEDGAERSFAGQYLTVLDVRGVSEVLAAITRATEWPRRGRLDAYEAAHGMPPAERPLTIIVQEFIRATSAGVAFSRNPLSGMDEVVITAVPLDGVALSPGEATGDEYRVTLEEHLDVRPGPYAARVLSDDQARAVARAARLLERRRGVPQDVEWAYLASGDLRILQTRPITALPATAERAGQVRLWDNSNIVESFPDLTLPLTFSIAVELYAAVYRQAFRTLGVPRPILERESDLFEQMLGLLQGRVYYNLTSWYRALALLPGFRLTAGFLEAMMGAARPGTGLAERSSPVAARAARWWEIGGMVLRLGAIWLRHPGAVARFRHRMNDLLERQGTPAAAATPEELLSEFDRFRERALRDWRTPIMNDFLLMLSHGALRRLATRWLGADAPHLVNAVLVQGDVASAEPGRELVRIAEAVRARADWRHVVLGTPPASLRARLGSDPGLASLATLIDHYLGAWGDRAPRELQLERPSYRDDPEPLLRALQALVRDLPPAQSRADVEAATEIRRRLRSEPLGRLRVALLSALLRATRRHIRWREELRLLRGRVFGVGRRFFGRLGEVLAAQGTLAQSDDVHYLSIDELRGMVRGTGVVGDVRALVEDRRRRYLGYAACPRLPSRFETRGAVTDPLAVEPGSSADTSSPPTAGVRAWHGIGAAHGRARGVCQVVMDPAQANIQTGHILAARSTDPGWVPLLVGAAGLLVEQGSLLSHSAIVARELGIPTVVGLAGLLEVLRSGDIVELDGATGSVMLVARREGET